ncbi:MAG TPA: hypothetical protein PKK00_14130 [Bacteroidales bacterium]|nr:hypothetical protein [Bacteroidales bacterium]HPS17400.1 hypothetical protein [Bacteroidales bacterium]
MKDKLEIKLKEGLNELKFGLGMDEVRKLLGNPDEIENVKEIEGNTEVWYYIEDGLTVFFGEEEGWRCICLETDNENAVVLGKKISELKESQIEKLFSSNGYNDFEAETETWGEKRIGISDAVIDFYFDGEDIVAVNWGMDYDDEGEPIWP